MSDIFNEYTQIALQQGLIKQAQESEDHNKVKNTTNPRFDSLDLEAIQALYGVTPNGEEDHIVEQAHPEPAVVAPSYDRFNGLAENGLERQDIMHYIATKPNHGKHIQERYVKARQELLNEVIKTAFALDRDNELQLMSLADQCAEKLVHLPIKKEAVAWGLVSLALKLGAAGLTAMGLINNFSGMVSEGLIDDADRAIEEIEDVISDDEIPGQTTALRDLVAKINQVKMLHQELTSLSISGSSKEVERQVEQGQELLINYAREAKSLSKELGQMIPILQAARDMGDESWYSGIGLERVIETFWTPDITEALNIMETLQSSLSKSITNLRKYYQAIKAKAESLYQEAQNQPASEPEPEGEGEGPEELPSVEELPNLS